MPMNLQPARGEPLDEAALHACAKDLLDLCLGYLREHKLPVAIAFFAGSGTTHCVLGNMPPEVMATVLVDAGEAMADSQLVEVYSTAPRQ
jgi:hypothetical protein